MLVFKIHMKVHTRCAECYASVPCIRVSLAFHQSLVVVCAACSSSSRVALLTVQTPLPMVTSRTCIFTLAMVDVLALHIHSQWWMCWPFIFRMLHQSRTLCFGSHPCRTNSLVAEKPFTSVAYTSVKCRQQPRPSTHSDAPTARYLRAIPRITVVLTEMI